MKKHFVVFLISFVLFINTLVIGQLSLSGTDPLTEDFNSMGTSGTANLPVGFKVSSGATYSMGSTATTLAYGTSGTGAVTGSSAGGAINWADGITAFSTDRSLGFLMTDNYTSPRSIMLAIQNNTGKTITQLVISWNYEKYRSGTRTTSWTFYTGITSSSWSESSGGNYSYSADPNNTTVFDPPSSTSKTVNITGLSIAPGSLYYFRWTCSGLGVSANTQGLGIDDLIISDFNTISAENSQIVSGTGLVNFNGEATGVSMNIGSITGSGNISVQKHNTAPLNSSSITLPHISQYRWIITADAGITNINTQLRFYLGDIPNHGINEGASDIKLYKRSTPGSGNFSEFGTMAYNNMGDGQTSDYLSMDGITSFSEFVFASETQSMPVELISFSGKVTSGKVELNWSTATEVNNFGFEIERTFIETRNGASQSWQNIGFIPGSGNSNAPKEYSFTDDLNHKVIRPYSTGAEYSHSIRYRLKQIDNNGSYSYSEEVVVDDIRPSSAAGGFDLRQNYPNPFNPSTVISYQLPVSGSVSLKLFDILGNEVAELVSGHQEAGYHEYKLSAIDHKLSSGIYYYTLETSDHFLAKKMILLK
ncbi:MAG: T9SS type A sorting domain-containing protein [Ignavibacteriaceae bacterium]